MHHHLALLTSISPLHRDLITLISCLLPRFDFKRPAITAFPAAIAYGAMFQVTFTAAERVGNFELNMESSPFVTHSLAMGQRLLKLQVTAPVAAADGTYTVEATAPPYAELAPPGYYMLWPVQDWIPGTAVWVKINW